MSSKNKKTPAAATAEAKVSTNLKKGNTMTNIASNQLTFHDTQFSVVNHKGKAWLTATELAKALQYKHAHSVSQVYSRNADEFSPGMTETLKLSASGNLKNEVRVFSLRGAHLVAMFSKTKVAKQFRKWVLDVLDQEVASPRLSNKSDRTPLKNAVNMLVGKTKSMSYSDVYRLVHQRFAVDSVDELPADKVPEAVEYLHRLVLEGELLAAPSEDTAPPKTLTLDCITDLPANSRMIVTDGDGGAMIRNLGQSAMVPLDQVSKIRRDILFIQKMQAELMERLRVFTGERSSNILDEPLGF